MQFQGRVELFKLPEECCVEVQAQLRMVAALQQELVAAQRKVSSIFFL